MKPVDLSPVLAVENLSVSFRTEEGRRHVVGGVSLSIRSGEAVAIVGESGSGKSVTLLAAMGVLPPTAMIKADAITLNGEDIVGATDARLATLRGTEISMVFQNPMASLNPTMRIGEQVSETVAVHDSNASQEALTALAG